MKRIIALMMAFVMLLCFSSCGKKAEEENTDSVSEETTQSPESEDVVPEELLVQKTIMIDGSRKIDINFYGSKENGIFNVTKAKTGLDGERKTVSIKDDEASIDASRTCALSSEENLRFAAEDINFDGYCDFRIQSVLTETADVTYICYLWDNAESNFKFAFEIINPKIYGDMKQIYSTHKNAEGVSVTEVYEIENNAPVPVSTVSETKASDVEFATDLSLFEQYMNPSDRDAYLKLVNTENTLDSTYVPENLIDVVNTRNDGRATQKMVECAERALEAMFMELKAAGYNDVSVTSGYRSYDYQSQLFNSYIDQEMTANGYTRDDATAVVKTYSAYPGTSEHQSGLCCDMHNLGSADQAFANEDAYKWLSENCWKFGFILRFPQGKEDITKITFEPWHYRFVGRYHAEQMYNLGMCLEEYIEYLNK